ncbi:hypothetical protein Arnit_0991 [Arcobacter nitrofigilis DSM 7299]|uniref:Lipoprotein n=1 Tax=Arcobacter nitrofigilis (strain ATCC 33309 / DSM 7299 / CCUG 15893 / LMG 7604 / NCTC 12251 / CI) TaxID=572480 RepID=D5V373_ARCNC|nr:hypothetical protein [Arcobacter nitrofigilis]ADG92655.1 hypothetical protein Arnit_0991 [Arcobacter nitrofigilis DSM 7299]
MIKKLISGLCIVTSILFFTGCNNIQPKQIAEIKNIGIICTLDNNLNAHEDGLTKFGTYDDIIDVSNWKINELVSNKFKEKLSNKYVTKIINKNDPDVLMLEEENTYDLKKEYIRKLMNKNSVNTVIVIKKANPVDTSWTGGLSVNRAKIILLPSLQSGTLYFQITFYQRINGVIDFENQMLISGFKLDDTFWDEENRTINKVKLPELEVMFKGKVTTLVNKYITDNKL